MVDKARFSTQPIAGSFNKAISRTQENSLHNESTPTNSIEKDSNVGISKINEMRTNDGKQISNQTKIDSKSILSLSTGSVIKSPNPETFNNNPSNILSNENNYNDRNTIVEEIGQKEVQNKRTFSESSTGKNLDRLA